MWKGWTQQPNIWPHSSAVNVLLQLNTVSWFRLRLWTLAVTEIRQWLGISLTLPGISNISFSDVHDRTALAPTADAQLVCLGGARRCGSNRLQLAESIPRIKGCCQPNLPEGVSANPPSLPRASCVAPSQRVRLSCSGLLTPRCVIHVQFKGPNFTKAMLIYPSLWSDHTYLF